MTQKRRRSRSLPFPDWSLRRGQIPTTPKVIVLAAVVGVAAGYGAVLFTILIDLVTTWTVEPFVADDGVWWKKIALCLVPAAGLLFVSWFTRRFAPEAQGHGVPEVIAAVARNNGVIRPRVSIVKTLASGLCIGTGGSIGREGPIVQIGSSLGSLGGQLLKLAPQHVKVLVAAGAAAGISATFNAPLAGVIFASEIILGNFAIASLTPVVIASVLADVVQAQYRTEGFEPAFSQLHYTYLGTWAQLPSYVVLGLVCGLAAVGFTKLIYHVEDVSQRWLPRWWVRALVFGMLVGITGVVYTATPPVVSLAAARVNERAGRPLPPLFGVGYDVVDHALHLETQSPQEVENQAVAARDKVVKLDAAMAHD